MRVRTLLLARHREAVQAAVLALSLAASPVAAQEPGDTFRDCGTCPEMVMVPAGTFVMGAALEDRPMDGPPHSVVIERSFAVSRHLVTRAQFLEFADSTGALPAGHCYAQDQAGRPGPVAGLTWTDPGFEQDPDHPVVCVGWAQVQSFLRWLSNKTGRTYRLLTEAEWEFLARAGADDQELSQLGTGDHANFGREECCGPGLSGHDRWDFTSPVGSFAPNSWGVYDLAGNVDEWLSDCVNGDYRGAPTDGSAWMVAERNQTDWARTGRTTDGQCFGHMIRGGNWTSVQPRPHWFTRRGWWYPHTQSNMLGFRVAASIDHTVEHVPWGLPRRDTLVIHSQVLGEDRTILLDHPDSVPASQDPAPVIVVLDGETHFEHVVSTSRFLSHRWNDRIPPVHVVGIVNTDRVRDLTPTRPLEYGDDVPTAGGADAFLSFLTTELFPTLEERVGAGGSRHLIGHSFGGLFGAHVILQQPTAFDGYVLISPSVWWGSEDILTGVGPTGMRDLPAGTSVYIAVGDERGRMMGGVWGLARRLELSTPQPRWHLEHYPDESHDSVVLQAAYAGIEWLLGAS